MRDTQAFFNGFQGDEWSTQVLRYQGFFNNAESSDLKDLRMNTYSLAFLRSFLEKKPVQISSKSNLIYFKSQFSPINISNHPNEMLTIIRVHDLFPITNPEWFTRKSRFAFKVGLSQIAPNSLLIANSQSTLQALQSVLGNEFSKYKTTVIPCKFQPRKNSKQCGNCFACKTGIPEAEFLIMVGTLEPRKNYNRVLDAWHLSKLRKQNIKLVIVGGKGWKCNSTLKKLVNSEDVYYFGYVCDYQLIRLYSDSLGFLSGSLNEGYNIPLDEAQEFKKSLILSDIEIHKERVNEKGAVWFDPKSIDSMLMALDNFEPNIESEQKVYLGNQFSSKFLEFSQKLKMGYFNE